MNPQLIVPALPGAFAAAAVIAIIIAIAPRQPDLAAAVSRVRSNTEPDITTLNTRGHIGAWISARAQRIGLQPPQRDLDLLEIRAEQYFLTKGAGALLGLFLPALIGAALQLTIGLSMGVPLLVGVAAAIAFWFLPDIVIRNRAKDARAEFARAMTVYLDLVATDIRRDVPAAEAIIGAAQAADSWVFVRIRQEIARARYEGIDSWAAIQRLASDIDVPELTEVAQILALVGEDGAAVKGALTGRARALRNKILKDHEAAQEARTQFLAGPQVLAGLCVIGILMTPAVINLTTSFL